MHPTYDTVVHRQAFETRWDVAIKHETGPVWHWSATWTDGSGHVHTITNHDLGPLMAQLEENARTGEIKRRK